MLTPAWDAASTKAKPLSRLSCSTLLVLVCVFMCHKSALPDCIPYWGNPLAEPGRLI